MFLYYIFITFPLWLLVLILFKRIIYKFLNVYPFDYTHVAVSGRMERSYTGYTTTVGGCCYSN